MSRYYKAEDVIRAIAEQLCFEARTEYGDKFTTEDWLEEAEDYVSDLPTIEIVHCEDCRLCDKGLVIERRKDGYTVIVNECRLTTIPTRVNLDHYCGHGERIEE